MNQINLILQRSISQANNRIEQTLQRLATGMRINSPADDPTGLVLSSNLNSEIRTLAQAMQNAQDGINLLHTGIDSLQTMESTLLKLKELTEKAANGTYSASERQEMQKQANELLKSLYTTKNTTSFGQINIFGSKLGSASAPSTPSVASYVNYAAFMYNTPSSVGSATNDGSSYERYEIKTTSSSKTLSASPPAYAPSSTSASSPVSAASDTSSSEIVLIRSEQEFIDKIAQDGTGTEGKTYVLNNDLDFSTISNYTAKENFAGTIIGNGHTIKNLTSDQGLFASTAESSSISGLTLDNFIITASEDYTGALVGNNRGDIDDVHVINSTINGGSYQNIGGLAGYSYNATISNSSSSATVSGGNHVGGLVGSSYATITNSYSTGDVTGTEDVGGLAGSTSGDISNSYATGNVSGTDNVGGLAGNHSTGSTISNSYATGDVTGTSSVGGLTGVTLPYAVIENSYATGTVTGTEYVGALAGLYGGVITNSFYNKETAGVSSALGSGSSYGVTGLTGSQFATSTPFVNAGWDETIWDFTVDGPHLALENYEPAPTEIHITSAQEFIDKIAQDGTGTAGRTYILDNDIDFSTISNYVAKENFSGTIIGNGHTIKNLTSDQGLFVTTTNTASISDLTLENFTITASENNTGALVGVNRGDIDDVHVINTTINGGSYQSIGGLVGYSYGTISNSSSSATVSGGNHVGGLVGTNDQGTVENNSASGAVSGNSVVGGLVGGNIKTGTILNSYATGTVFGTESAGGLIGLLDGSILNSYSTGDVTGDASVGGLVGIAGSSSISNSYSTGTVTGTTDVGGLVGQSQYTNIVDSYTTSNVKGSSYTGAFVGRQNYGTITNSFYNTETAGVSSALGSGSSYGVTGLTGSQFATSTPFVNAGWSEADWDFTVDGPHLVWENYEPAGSTIHISSAQEFIDKIAQNGADTEGKTYVLDNDIDFSTISNYVAKTNFAGTIIGNGHTIKNLTSDQGLFVTTTNTASISDLTLENFTITASSGGIGALVGVNRGDIDDVHVINATINGGGSYQDIGGLIGNNQSGDISNSSADVTITGDGGMYGGLVGQVVNGTITNSSSSGSISGNSVVGGLIGDFSSGGSASITNSYSTADVTGNTAVGGFIGYMSTGGGSVADSYSSGNVNGNSSAENIGGFVGDMNSGTLTNVYAYGEVNTDSTNNVGGFAGKITSGNITNSFWNTTAAGTTAVGNGSSSGMTGLSEKEFSAHNFAADGWDTSIWDFNEDRPHLKTENYLPPTAGGTGVGQISAEEAEQLGYILIWNFNDFIDKIAQDGSGTAGKTYILMNDINMSSLSDYKAKENFAGTFLGNGYTIKNLTSGGGLFSSTTADAEIKDVTLDNFNVEANASNTGILVDTNAGNIENVKITNSNITTGNAAILFSSVGGLAGTSSGTISNSSVDVDIDGAFDAVGGLIGHNTGTITDSLTSGTITGVKNYQVGGLVGENDGTISGSSSTVDVEGHTNIGGLVGLNNSGTISDSHAEGSVSGNSAGGLIGNNNGGTIDNSYATGNVEGNDKTGGLIGVNSGTITDSHAEGDVKGSNRTGGLVGSNGGTITDSHAEGDVTGTENTGGLIGLNNYATITGSYAEGSVNGKTNTGGLIGQNNSGTIENSHATGRVESSGENTGGLVGWNNGAGIITNSYAAGNVEGRDKSGGLVGSNEGSTIENSYATGNVNQTNVMTSIIGGLVGYNSGTITGSHAEGNVSGQIGVGGLVGQHSSGSITGSYATGDILGQTNVGGFAGYNNGIIENGYATGDVEGSDNAGGFAGVNYGTITGSYAEGAVSGYSAIGGFVGVNSTTASGNGAISDSYSIGTVTGIAGGSGNIGGFVGNMTYGTFTNVYSYGAVNLSATNTGGFAGTITGGSVVNSFWNTTAAGMTGVSSGASTGLTGLTTQEFMNMNNFVGAGWNDTIWNLTQGNPRPHLEWENYVGPGVDPGDEGDPDFDGYPDTPGSGGQSGSYPTDPGNNDAKTEVVLQIGTDNGESSRWTIDTSLDFDDIWINLSNSDTARISLESIDNALATVREKIASFSTTADILKSSIETSEAKSENLEAAKSTILDADIAAEMVELMKAKRQFELSNTMLIQAGNIQYNQAMALIEGLNFASSGQEVQNSLNNIQRNGREHQSILNSIQNNNIYHQSILDVVADNNAKNNIILKMINKYK